MLYRFKNAYINTDEISSIYVYKTMNASYPYGLAVQMKTCLAHKVMYRNEINRDNEAENIASIANKEFEKGGTKNEING